MLLFFWERVYSEGGEITEQSCRILISKPEHPVNRRKPETCGLCELSCAIISRGEEGREANSMTPLGEGRDALFGTTLTSGRELMKLALKGAADELKRTPSGRLDPAAPARLFKAPNLP